MDDWKTLYKNGGWEGVGSGTGSLLKNNLILIEWFVDFIRSNNIKSILDVACGDMQWIPFLLERVNVSYLGIDYVDYLIDSNKKMYPHLSFVCGDV